ncbi:MAG: GNAT family N-acetyltransferase [Bacteroidota bacterium]
MEKKKPETVFKSLRLYARLFRAEDLPQMLRLNGNHKVMEWIGPVQTEADAQAYLERILAYYPGDPGYGAFSLHLRKSGEFVGMVMLKNLDQTPEKEVGYRLLPNFWGRGFATEISRAALEYAFWENELDQVAAVTRPDNFRSINVIEKLGMRYKRRAHFYKTDVKYYVLTRDEWERGVDLGR